MSAKPRIFSNIVENPAAKSPSNYGLRTDPFTGQEKKHNGVDISTPVGTPINAPADGVVYYVGSSMSGYGNVVVIAHPNAANPTSFTLYAHLKDDSTKPTDIGKHVSAGDQIAESGNTGSRTTGPHLHYEERVVKSDQVIASLPSIKGSDSAVDKALNAIKGTFLSASAVDPKDNQFGFGTWDPTRVDRDALTKLERIAQLRLSDNEFESYKTQLASIETKGKGLEESYQTTSQSGEYLGRYQMGKATGLLAAGYMDKAGNWTEYAKTQGITSQRDFLNSPGAQDDALRRLTDKNAEFAVRNDLDLYIGDVIGGKVLTGAGILLGAHNSPEHVDDYVKSFGEMDGVDGNKFGISNYVALGDKVQPHQKEPSSSGPTSGQAGHWEDRTAYDIMTGLPIGGENKVWVVDPPIASTGGAPTPGTVSPLANPPSTTYPSNSSTVHHADGDTTVSYVAKGDSSDGSIRKGDLVTYVQNADGKTTYLGVTHKEGNETTLQERVIDPITGEVVLTYSQWAGSGNVSLQFQGQWDAAGNRVGERYTQDGETYSKTAHGTGVAQWLNERGQSRQQWLADPENPHGANAVNGSDRQSDDSELPKRDASGDFGKALFDAFEDAQIAPGGAGTQYADAGNGTVSDAGGGGPSSVSTDTGFNVADLTTPDLARHFTRGARQIGGFDVLPFNENSSFLVNADGDIAGEINRLGNGYVQIKDLSGNIAYVNEQTGQALSAESYDRAQASEVGSALGLMQSIIGLQNWDGMSDLQRVAAMVSVYNVVDKLSGGNSLPGELGTTASVLGLLHALDKGDIGGIAYSGLSMVEALTSTATQAGWVTQSIGGNFLPAMGFVLALDSGDPVSIASSGLSLMSSLGYIGPWGSIAAVAVGLLGSMFSSKPDLPMREGIAHAEWDAAGNTVVITDQNNHGGGATAAGWMNSLVSGLEIQLANTHDAAGNSYALIPNLLPAIGFQYDPDGFNLANGATGFMVLRWTDEAGQSQTRYYDGAGNRGDGTGETLAGDFMTHAQGAIAPSWQVATTLAHFQQGQGVDIPESASGLPQETGDGVHQSLAALTLALPVEPAFVDALVDVDGDSYLERTQWLANNQSVLAIDSNGDGEIGAGEFLNLNSAGLNSLNWMDVNNDHLIDARDPAFAALRLWIDVNSDGHSGGETNALTQAGITAIDFGSNPPCIIYANGSRTALTVQTLKADIFGTIYQNSAGGILQLDEQRNADGTLAAPTALLHAVNTRHFDGQAAHINGGIAAATTPGTSTSNVDAGDTRLSSVSAKTIANQSSQTSSTVNAGDARLLSAPHNGAAGQTPTQTAAATTVQIRSNAITFTPAAGSSAAQEQRQATDAMIRSAAGSLFETASSALPLAAVAIGVAAVQWPAVAGAANPTSQGINAQTNALANSSANAQTWIADQLRNDSQIDLSPNTSITDHARNDSYQSTALPTAAIFATAVTTAGAPQSLGAERLGDDSAFGTSTGSSPVTTDAISVIPDSIGDSDVSDIVRNAASSSSTTLTTTAGLLLDYPRTKGELANGVEDTILRFAETQLLANDHTVNAPASPNRPGLRITAVFAPLHGSVALQAGADGTTDIIFNPEVNYHGLASFSYTVTDQYGLSSNATTSLSIAAVNDAPLTAGEAAAGDEDNTLRFTAASLLANDSDADTAVDGDVLRITRVGMAQHGQVFLGPDGTVGFVPDANYNGPAHFSYWVGDRDTAQIAAGVGYEIAASVILNILPVNDLPMVTGETLANDEDIILNIDPALLLANDTDIDVATNGQVLGISAVSNAQHGTIALLPNGFLQFTPERDYFGAAGFSYTVSDENGGSVTGQVVVNLAPVNDAPALMGETVPFNEDEIQTISAAGLLANDADVDNPHSSLRIVSVGNATHGSASLNPDGSIRFTPEADYFGPALFTYTVSDGSGGFSVGTATLDIAPINDAPRLLGDSLTLDEDTQAHFSISSLLANDVDVDNLHTDLHITAATIDPASAANGSVSIVAGQIVFVPTLNFNGQASFTYTVSDGLGGVSNTSVNLTFDPINDTPVANSELVFGKRDISYTLTQAALLANDTDVETPSSLHISSIGNVQHGTATLNLDGSVRFTPDSGYGGRGSFDYVVMDPNGASSSATAQIDFSRINTSPLTTNDSFSGFEDVAFSITASQLLVNDIDADNAQADLHVTAVGGATNGTVSLQADGTVRFLASANFYGTANFNYQVSDGDGGQTWAMAQLSVQSVNDAPVIEDVWGGRPIYGSYQQLAGYDESGQPVYNSIQVNSESQARSLFYSGQLIGGSGSFYQNGQLRPAGFSYIDAVGGYDESGNPLSYVDDPYRQQGGVVAYDPDGNSSQLSFSISGSPQHGHAWANMYTSSTAPGSLDHTQAGPYWVGETGAWQYYSQRGDGYTGVDYFTVRATDSGGAVVDRTIGVTHTGSPAGGGGGGKKPVTLDLNGNGLHYVGIDDSNAYFDINNDGWREHLAWLAPDDGLLVRDIGGDGRINRYDEISFTGYMPGAKTDLEGLGAFDSNHDGILSRLDTRWKEFAVWQDVNGDAVSDAGEVHTLDDIGIEQIGLTSDHQTRTVNGVTEHGQAQFAWTDAHGGHTGVVGDVSLPFDMEARLPAIEAFASTPNAITPTPMQMALLMNQIINALTAAPDAEPLTFIPLCNEVELPPAQDQWEQVANATALQGVAS